MDKTININHFRMLSLVSFGQQRTSRILVLAAPDQEIQLSPLVPLHNLLQLSWVDVAAHSHPSTFLGVHPAITRTTRCIVRVEPDYEIKERLDVGE